MNYNKTIVIFPQDPTLDSLLPVYEFLKSVIPETNLFRPTTKIDLSKIISDIDCVIFMGHGASDKLYGYCDKTNEKALLIDKVTAIELFTNKSLLLLACSSDEFIPKIKRVTSLNISIGFGDMPTDWKHINSIRDQDPNEFVDFKEEHLIFYKDCITEVVLYALGNKTPNLYNIYLKISHSISKKINSVIFNKTWNKNQKIQVIKMLSDLKSECTCFHK